jgi:signal transduction histidine kinase
MGSAEELEALLAARTAELARAHGALATFASAANHDLKAPLRHIHMFADLIRREQGDALDAATRDYLARILGAVGRSERLVAALVDYARLASTPPVLAVVDLGDIARAAAVALEPKLTAAKAELQLDALPIALGDREQLEQVFTALIDNAVTHAGEDAPVIAVTGSQQDGWITLRVTDTGPGVPKGHEETAFEPLRRFNAPAGAPGEGMGLALCRMVLENHGGRIAIDADHRPGLAVEFTLPAAP